MYDFLVDAIHTIWKNGLTLSSLGAVLILLLKNRRLKRYLNDHLPKMLRDYDDERLRRMESKIDLMMKERGLTWDADLKPLNKSTRPISWSYSRRILVLIAAWFMKWMAIQKFNKWRMKRMKEYLKKLGSRKFQALLTSIVVNVISAVLFITQTVDIDGALNQWMPIINVSVLTASTWVYIWVEGKIDATKPPSAQAEVAVTDEPIHPLDTH